MSVQNLKYVLFALVIFSVVMILVERIGRTFKHSVGDVPPFIRKPHCLSRIYGCVKQTTWKATESLPQRTLSHFFPIQESLSRSVEGDILHPLPGYRNPCWMEILDNTTKPTENSYRLTKRKSIGHGLVGLRRWYSGLLSRGESSQSTRLRCLPAFYVAGVYKAGSSDFFQSLSLHPGLVPPVLKEPIFNLWRWGHFEPYSFRDYLGLYDIAASRIYQANGRFGRINPLLTFDGTPDYLHMYSHWRALPWNRNASEPRLIIAHHLKILNPNAKFLFLLREPADWVKSCYNFCHHEKQNFSSQDLHDTTLASISHFRQCVTTHDVRHCVYHIIEDRCDVLNALYFVFLRDWMKIFDHKQLFVIKSEDYFNNRTRNMSDVFKFLNVPQLPTAIEETVRESAVVNKGIARVKMFTKTQMLIRKFMQIWNRKLAKLLGHDRPFWEDTTTT